MKKFLKTIIEQTPFYHPLRNIRTRRHHKEELSAWEGSDKKGPDPHLIKQAAIKRYAKEFDLKILVETGTHYGDMIEAMKRSFDELYSIELSIDFYKKAKRRFAGDQKIRLLQGDSGEELKNLVSKLERPTLFWLDGHYSGGVTAKGEKDTPIYEELEHIFSGCNIKYVIIIDDCRCFGTDPSYPTKDELSNFIKSKHSSFNICIENDSIRITPSA